jgi:hypothetical protein
MNLARRGTERLPKKSAMQSAGAARAAGCIPTHSRNIRTPAKLEGVNNYERWPANGLGPAQFWLGVSPDGRRVSAFLVANSGRQSGHFKLMS